MKRLSAFLNLQYFNTQRLSFFFAMAVVPMLLWLLQQSTHELVESRSWVEHTYSVLAKLDRLRIDTGMIESTRLEYLINRQDTYLKAYYQVQNSLPNDLTELQKLTIDNAVQQERLDTLTPMISQLLSLAKTEIAAKAAGAAQPAESMVRSQNMMMQVRDQLEKMSLEEQLLLRVRSADSASKLHQLHLWLMIVGAIFMLLVILAFMHGQREIVQRRRAEQMLKESHVINEVTVRNLSLMGEMNSLLQACSDTDESLDVIGQYSARLLNTEAGALYLFRESRNQVEVSVSWGEESKSDMIFQPEDCWALRRGETHILNHADHSIACRHLQDWSDICSACIPIVAQGNVLGILHLENHGGRDISPAERDLAHNLASQIALAMSSIKLRDTLRNLSVRDPLTGLFNRRYMEESLQREIANAQRKSRPLGLVILDLDHFKTFNDSFGHDAGDLLLREVGALLAKHSRAGDIACRFGGEEFVIIFPEASAEIVLQLTNQLRKTIYALQLQHFGRALGQVSASFGVAAFPEHGNTTDALLRAADKALYHAKASGRNRVELSGSHSEIVI